MMGDALAMAVMQARGFNEEDFARSHPAGALGARLLNKVHHLMRTGDAIPQVNCLVRKLSLIRPESAAILISSPSRPSETHPDNKKDK
jgi:hypothetical protein